MASTIEPVMPRGTTIAPVVSADLADYGWRPRPVSRPPRRVAHAPFRRVGGRIVVGLRTLPRGSGGLEIWSITSAPTLDALFVGALAPFVLERFAAPRSVERHKGHDAEHDGVTSVSQASPRRRGSAHSAHLIVSPIVASRREDYARRRPFHRSDSHVPHPHVRTRHHRARLPRRPAPAEPPASMT